MSIPSGMIKRRSASSLGHKAQPAGLRVGPLWPRRLPAASSLRLLASLGLTAMVWRAMLQRAGVFVRRLLLGARASSSPWRAHHHSQSGASATRTMSMKRHMEPSWPSAVALIGAALYILGWVGQPQALWWVNVVGVSLCVIVALGLVHRAWTARDGAMSLGSELELLAVCALASLAMTRTLAPVGAQVYAINYLCFALIGAFASRRALVLALVAAVALECGAYALSGVGAQSWAGLGLNVGLLAGFGVMAHLVHGVELHDRRRRHRQEVEQERENMLREAREFRLMHSGRIWDLVEDRERQEALIMYDAVEALHHTTYMSLGLLKTALSCHTCVLLWYDLRQESMHIKELVSDCDDIVEGAIDPARGAIGGIVRRREPVTMSELGANYRGLPYYRDAQGVRHFLGVPVLEQGHLRGVLCVDRRSGLPFDATDVEILEETANYILRAVQNERLFASVEKSKNELGRFFEASKRLNAVLTKDDVLREALRSVADISPFEFAAVTTYEPETKEHVIARIEAIDALSAQIKGFSGRSFAANQGLVSMVVNNRHYLPFNGQVRDPEQLIFTRREELKGLKSLLILPLIAQDQAIGTLVLGHRQHGRYNQERREMLEIVSHQIAVSLQNANLYARMEIMATRDALTNLSNRRDFLNKLSEAVARHRRTNKTFSLILTDIDKFKSVNDTYGHPVGDEVLRQVSATFRRCLRETDLPGRYGGEEFIILLEDTEAQGAKVLAERLRQEVGALTFQSDQGPFQRTISMGIACWPDDERDVETLIDLADQALYYSKTHGRDQVSVYREVKSQLKGGAHA